MSIDDDGLDAAANPHCPDCAVTMRILPDGWECPVCSHTIEGPPVHLPPEFEGAAIWGG